MITIIIVNYKRNYYAFSKKGEIRLKIREFRGRGKIEK
ncbi:hypothetical protein FH5_01875 [Priestia endophytica]|nr:hypothetical protein FH5_01875 [Priestia endophytica]